MNFTKPPRKFLIDSFIYYEYMGDDEWSSATYKEGVEINHCRIDRSAEYAVSGNTQTLIYNALIFCYKGITDPLPEFKEQSKVVFDGREHIITNIQAPREPYKDEVYSYEIEVV